jgi:hypothetical protein
LVPTVGQRAVATGVKFWLGPSLALGEKVTSGLVWKFSTFDCVSDNLAYFKDSLGDSGSFLDVGSHRFYVTKPFPEEVTDVIDPLCDTGSDYSESSDLCTMVEVLALEDDGGSDLPRTACPPLERPPQQEQDLPPPERDVLDAAITDLRAPLDLTADPIKLSEDLERTHRNLLKEAIGVEDTRRRVLSKHHEYNTAQGFTPAGDGPSRVGQVRQRGRELGAELNQAAPSAKLPPVIAKPTYSTPTKNLHAARYITSELAGLQGEDLREKQARLQELLDVADLQQQAMEPHREASGTRDDNRIVIASQNKSQAQASSPNHGPTEHSRSNRAPGKSGGNHRTHHSGHHSRQPRDPAAVTSKPRNHPRPDAAEPAHGKSAAQLALAPAAGQGAQGHQPARSHVSLRIGEHIDPPKDDARHRLNQLADSKFDEEESSAGLVCFGPHICNEPFQAKFALPRDMPKYTVVVKPEDCYQTTSPPSTSREATRGRRCTTRRSCSQDLLGHGSIACRLYRSTHGMTSRKRLSRTSPGLTSDRPAHGSWPFASRVRTSQTVTTS